MAEVVFLLWVAGWIAASIRMVSHIRDLERWGVEFQDGSKVKVHGVLTIKLVVVLFFGVWIWYLFGRVE